MSAVRLVRRFDEAQPKRHVRQAHRLPWRVQSCCSVEPSMAWPAHAYVVVGIGGVSRSVLVPTVRVGVGVRPLSGAPTADPAGSIAGCTLLAPDPLVRPSVGSGVSMQRPRMLLPVAARLCSTAREVVSGDLLDRAALTLDAHAVGAQDLKDFEPAKLVALAERAAAAGSGGVAQGAVDSLFVWFEVEASRVSGEPITISGEAIGQEASRLAAPFGAEPGLDVLPSRLPGKRK